MAFLSSLFGGGRAQVPEPLRSAVLAETPVLFEEGLRGSITYRHYHAPGRYSSWAREPTGGAIAVTPRRLLVWITNGGYVNVGLVEGRPMGITVHTDRPDRVSFGYDAAAFSTDSRGQVQIRLRTPSAVRLAQMLAG